MLAHHDSSPGPPHLLEMPLLVSWRVQSASETFPRWCLVFTSWMTKPRGSVKKALVSRVGKKRDAGAILWDNLPHDATHLLQSCHPFTRSWDWFSVRSAADTKVLLFWSVPLTIGWQSFQTLLYFIMILLCGYLTTEKKEPSQVTGIWTHDLSFPDWSALRFHAPWPSNVNQDYIYLPRACLK